MHAGSGASEEIRSDEIIEMIGGKFDGNPQIVSGRRLTISEKSLDLKRTRYRSRSRAVARRRLRASFGIVVIARRLLAPAANLLERGYSATLTGHLRRVASKPDRHSVEHLMRVFAVKHPPQ